MSQVSFTVALSTSIGISLTINPTVISFYPDNHVAIVTLYINDATQWVVGAATSLTPTSPLLQQLPPQLRWRYQPSLDSCCSTW